MGELIVMKNIFKEVNYVNIKEYLGKVVFPNLFKTIYAIKLPVSSVTY